MSKYKEIKGFKVQTLASDTAASVIDSGVWSSAPNLNATIREGGGSGTSTSAINVGGYPYPMTSEQWNGSTWATFANMATPRGKNASAGTYTNAIVGNGSTPGTPGAGRLNLVESWNGSAWSEITEINSIRDANAMSAGGTNTAVIYFGGAAPGGVSALNESWNGSAWTEVADLNTARSYLTGMGTQTASLAVGGSTGTAVESWNGSSWSEVAEVNTSRNYAAGSSASSTDGLVFGGNPALANTEAWNGSTWTEVNDLATGRHHLKGAGPSSTAALAFGGLTPSVTAVTEEWTTTPAPTFQKINLGQVYYNSTSNAYKVTEQPVPGGTWASGGNINTPRGFNTGAGTQTSALSIAGYNPSGTLNVVENYNGTSWTEIAEVNDARSEAGGFGTSTAANFVGGYAPTAPGRVASNESWNGSAWTEVNDMPAATDNLMQGAGTQTAGMIVAGQTSGGAGGKSTQNVFYDGTNWTAQATLNAARTLAAVSGNQTSALIASGLTGNPTASTVNVEQWNGSAWTEVGNVNSARYRVVGSGNGDSSIAFAGTNYPSTTNYALTEAWNGSSWTEIADLSTGREGGSSTANTGATSTLMAGGSQGSTMVNSTEEWTTSVSNSTITVS
jgi:hypothetical protein